MIKQDIEKLFNDISKLKVAIIGDVMLDTYWWGNVERISPEAPVPVVAVSQREKRIGGAGNVALNAKMLGASVAVLTLLGVDDDGNEVKQMLQDQGIDTRFILTSRKRITTNKIRIISRNQQMLRLDAELSDDLDNDDEEKLLGIIQKYIHAEKPDVVIMEDYNKGIFTKNIISETIELCNKAGIVTAVDPKRKNFFEYRNVTLFKPNLHEAITGLNILTSPITEEWLASIHDRLKEQLNHKVSLITLSEKGIFYKENEDEKIIPAHKREIADVSGAGDTVIAVASLVYAATKDIEETTWLANIAGGLVCEDVGTVPITRERLQQEALSIQKKEASVETSNVE